MIYLGLISSHKKDGIVTWVCRLFTSTGPCLRFAHIGFEFLKVRTWWFLGRHKTHHIHRESFLLPTTFLLNKATDGELSGEYLLLWILWVITLNVSCFALIHFAPLCFLRFCKSTGFQSFQRSLCKKVASVFWPRNRKHGNFMCFQMSGVKLKSGEKK